ncbi:MAG: hypothetical protein H7146_02385 [Burkholderiaceae bacterium]|nr:hypothetical protein [Microbacteriaceae bacterium]
MTTISHDEDQLIDLVVARLAQRNPGTTPERISATVHEEHHRLDGRPVRAFLSVVVERSAKARHVAVTSLSPA